MQADRLFEAVRFLLLMASAGLIAEGWLLLRHRRTLQHVRTRVGAERLNVDCQGPRGLTASQLRSHRESATRSATTARRLMLGAMVSVALSTSGVLIFLNEVSAIADVLWLLGSVGVAVTPAFVLALRYGSFALRDSALAERLSVGALFSAFVLYGSVWAGSVEFWSLALVFVGVLLLTWLTLRRAAANLGLERGNLVEASLSGRQRLVWSAAATGCGFLSCAEWEHLGAEALLVVAPVAIVFLVNQAILRVGKGRHRAWSAPRVLLLQSSRAPTRGSDPFTTLARRIGHSMRVDILVDPDAWSGAWEKKAPAGYLRESFLTTAVSLSQALTDARKPTDWTDGSFPVRLFRCLENGWHAAAVALMSEANAVVVDARGEEPRLERLTYELEMMRRLRVSKRAVVLVDSSSDRSSVSQLAGEAVTYADNDLTSAELEELVWSVILRNASEERELLAADVPDLYDGPLSLRFDRVPAQTNIWIPSR